MDGWGNSIIIIIIIIIMLERLQTFIMLQTVNIYLVNFASMIIFHLIRGGRGMFEPRGTFAPCW